MKILTLNCHSWQEDKQLEKIKYIAKNINKNNYDVIALQEVSQKITSKVVYENIKEDNFALVLQKELEKLGNFNYNFFWDMCHIGYDIYEEGLCLMTKLPIHKKESFFITNSNDYNFWKTRKIVKLKVSYEGEEISFYSCHLGWWHDEEEPFINQADKLLENIKEENRTFIMGDFNNNANIKNEGYDYLCKNLVDTYSLAINKDDGVTVEGNIAGWDYNNEKLRLDLILSNKKVEVLSSNVIFNNINKDIVSDHYGVEVEVKI
ncbi:endonuclease/exonuclease/phosphatase family protein [[Clostridium] dakarense]|uniref:endonuclease/exonuclease/phosphatase family protein n=1 Tax=Faecalimicrobium dakarense TaxID=1301100 RepID=UPI0004BB12D8|nr:endonuclease/exonuclease/phosphatase family protein [[Clostridium] dakarense]